MLNYKKIASLTPHFGKGPKDLLSYKEFENLLNNRPFLTNNRFTPAKDEIRYEWKNSPWALDQDCWPISTVLKVLDYTSIYLRDCSRVNKKINGFSEGLENVLKKPIDCHIYFSNKLNSDNFGKHMDENHNVIVVCEGKLNFKIYNGNKIMNKNLSKGDYCFVPAHMYHMVTPLTTKRLSCSFPCELIDNNFEAFEDRKWYKV